VILFLILTQRSKTKLKLSEFEQCAEVESSTVLQQLLIEDAGHCWAVQGVLEGSGAGGSSEKPGELRGKSKSRE